MTARLRVMLLGGLGEVEWRAFWERLLADIEDRQVQMQWRLSNPASDDSQQT